MRSSSSEPLAYREIPRVPWRELSRMVGNQGSRIDMRSSLERRYRMLGPVSRGPLVKMVNLFGPDANRFVLTDTERVFSARRPWMLIMGKIFPNGLLLMDGEQHRHHRRIMHGTFKRPVLREYTERMGPRIALGLDDWPDEGRWLAFPALKRLTLDLAASIFIGMDPGPGTRRMSEAFEQMVAASMSRVRLPLPGLEFQRGLRGRAHMLETLAGMVSKKRAGDGADMFSRLCHAETETGESFDDSEVFDHMIFLVMAAHDTTTSVLASLIYELARHPEWQERLRDESRALGSAVPGYDDLERLPALGAAMHEALRLYPPLPVIPRTATASFRFGGFEIPEGAMVIVSPIHTHYMEEWWTEPERFDPERFSSARAEHERHTHSWVPFGGGPHMCLGRRFAEAQVHLILHQALLRWRWRVDPGYEMPVQQAPISKPRDGLPITLEPIA